MADKPELKPADKPELKPKTCGDKTFTGDEPINNWGNSKYWQLRSENIREIIGLLECALDYKDYEQPKNDKIDDLVKGKIYNLKLKRDLPVVKKSLLSGIRNKSNVPEEEEEVVLWNCVFLGSTEVKINRYSPEIGRSSVFSEKREEEEEDFDKNAIKIVCHFCVEERYKLKFIVQIDPEHIVQAKCRTSMLTPRELFGEEAKLINESNCGKNGGAKINIKRKTTTKTMKKKSTTTKKDKKGTTYKKKDKKGTKLLIKKIETP